MFLPSISQSLNGPSHPSVCNRRSIVPPIFLSSRACRSFG
jgi:hypothetical protein